MPKGATGPANFMQQTCRASAGDALAGVKYAEGVRAQSRRCPRLLKRMNGRFAALIRQLKGAPMHTYTLARAGVEMGLNGLGRVHVGALHKPPRLVRADRDQRQLGCTTPKANLAK